MKEKTCKASVRNALQLDSFFRALESDLVRVNLGNCEASQGFAVNRLASRMRKRAKYVNPNLREETIQRFLELNDSLAGKRVNVDPQIIADARHFILIALERYSTMMNERNIQVNLDLDVLFTSWRFGPGASNGVKGTHAAEKIGSDFTCTERAFPWVYKLRQRDYYFRCADTLHQKVPLSVVHGSRLTTVPKNQETDRTIAIEPLGNMVMQLAAGSYLTGALFAVGLDIEHQQPKNKALAHRGSITGGFATIDMKSASDMILPELVRLLLPAEWFRLLSDLRSETVSVDGREVKLNMMSTMGNGFTFPLMTLIITALIYGFRAQKPGSRNLFVDWKQTAVFGDDVIVPTEEAAGVVDVLTAAGFVINHDKSYLDGPFRESCGGDYYEGRCVTPFYVSSLQTNAEIYIAINKVLEWCARENLILLNTLHALSDMLKGPMFLVPEWENPDSGVLTQGCSPRYKRLVPKRRTVEIKDEEFLSLWGMPLVLAGFVEESPTMANVVKQAAKLGREIQFSFVEFCPRTAKTAYRVENRRLPKGYANGWAPEKRSGVDSAFIEAWVSVVFDAGSGVLPERENCGT